MQTVSACLIMTNFTIRLRPHKDFDDDYQRTSGLPFQVPNSTGSLIYMNQYSPQSVYHKYSDDHTDHPQVTLKFSIS
jgi:hypothetical protein